jgi:hypothetical protein
MTQRYPCTIETRLTYDRGEKVGMHCDYPLGLFNNVQCQGQKAEIDRGQWSIGILLDFRPDRWALISDVTSQPMTKIRVPAGVEPDFQEYQFYFYGKLYILEFRFDSISGAA